MLSTVASQTKTWLIGGIESLIGNVLRISYFSLGSIPERDVKTNAVYNTCTVYNPKGQIGSIRRALHK